MRAKLLFLFFLFSLLSFKLFSDEKIKLNLEVLPKSYKGSCPKEFIFKGTIVAKEPMVVKYKFLRSDGAVAPPKVIEFKSPGEKEVLDNWILSADYKGWEQIQILAPYEVFSNKAEFNLECVGVRYQPKPDLIVGKFNIKKVSSDSKKTNVKLEIQIANASDVPTDKSIVLNKKGFVVKVDGIHYPSGKSYEIGRKKIKKLNGKEKLDFVLDDSIKIGQEVKYLAIVDYENSIEEENEQNNQMSAVFKGE